MKKILLFKLSLTFLLALFFSVGWVSAQSQGDILITEYMADPAAVTDGDGEYFELYNTTASPIDIEGWVIKDDGSDSHTIVGSNIIPAYGFFVLGQGDGTYNSRDYELPGNWYLSNSGDEIILETPGAVEICRVVFTDGDKFEPASCELNNIANHTNGVTLEADYIAATDALMSDFGSPGFAGNTIGTGGADTDPPVPTFDPADGATGVAINVNPTITFDETIYTTGGVLVDDSNVESLISLMYGAAIPASFTATISGTTITIVPDTDLEFGENHSLTIQPVEDELGNEMDAVASINFTTIAEDAPSIDLTSTHAGNTYYGGENVTVTWTSRNVTTLDLQVWLPVDGLWQTIETGLNAADGTVTTTPPVDIDYATTYKLRLKDADSETYSSESGEFTLIPVLPVHEIQSNADVDGNSSYVNDFVKTGGIVSAVKSTDNFFIQAGLGEFSGINVYETAHGLAVGDSIVIEAKVVEQYNMTQLSDVVMVSNHGNFEPWDATTIATGDMGEAYECVLVTVENAEVIDNSLGYGEFSVSDGSGEVVVDDAIYSYDLPENGNMFASITGPVEYSFGAFKILPRTVDDFILLSNDATLSTFTLGGEDVTGLTDLEVADPVNDAGATLNVADFTGFEGIVIEATDAAATVTVELNGTEVVEGDYATQALADGDVVVATAEAEDGTMAYYKVTLVEENRVLEITGPSLPATYQTGDNATFTWNATNIDTVNIYVVDTEEAHLINEEGVIDATLGTYTYTIANGDFGTFTIRITDASDETFFDETTEEVTVNDIQHPEGIQYYPEMGAVDVPVNFTLSVLFDEDVVIGTGSFTIYDASDDSQVLNFTETDFTINEDVLTVGVSGLDYETGYYILADAGIIEDLSGNATPVLDDPTVWTFTTKAAPESDLFFSEYIEGSSDNKALEIFNPTATEVDLSNYVIRINYNGNLWNEVFEFPAGTILPSEEVFVIAHADADAAILAETDTAVVNPYGGGESYVAVFNGDDVRALCKVEGEDTTIIDIIGRYDGVDPGSGWSVAGVDNATSNHTLIRKSSILAGNPDWDLSAGTNETDSEWIVYPEDYIEHIGTHAIGLSAEAEIFEFTFGPSIEYEDAVINSTNATVDITVINGTNVTALTPTITISDGAEISPASGVEQDFTNPVVYTVTAEDGTTTKDWTVTVTELATVSDKANITDVELAGVDSIKINDTDATVMIYAPYGFDVTSVKPEFTVSAGATIADTAAARDFTSLQVYDVTAQDGTTIKNWEVTIDVVEATAVTIYNIQYTIDASGDSPYLGELVLTSGIVTYIDGSNIWVQDGAGAWNGVMVYSGTMSGSVAIGDEVEFVAEVDEYFNLTELKNVENVSIVSSDNDLPAPAEITTLEANDEDYESVLVKVSGATCTNEDAGYGMFVVNDGSGDILIDDVFYAFTPTLDHVYDITGIADYSYSERKILPRNANDIEDVTTNINTPDGIVSMNVYPNPSKGEFTLEMNATKAGTFHVEIINMLGQVVYQKQITQDGFYRESIDISDKARGLYYIRMSDGTSEKTAKILIQ